MRTRVKKHRLGSTKPASQLFLFSNNLNKDIDNYFSGNVIIEIELSGYDFKYHEEAKKVVYFMNLYCESLAIKPYKFMTVVLNYKASGLTMTALSGGYEFPIAVHGLAGYKKLTSIHSAYETLKECQNSFEIYKNWSLHYALIAKNEPIKLPNRSIATLKNQHIKTEQGILKSMSKVLLTFHKKFRPSYYK